jgi:hypothetical protein
MGASLLGFSTYGSFALSDTSYIDSKKDVSSVDTSFLGVYSEPFDKNSL